MTEVTLTEAQERFVDRIGQILEKDGLTRIAGRVFGCLLLADGPLSLEDLATQLRASRGSISQETRLLERLGALERVTHAGDRRVFYQVGDRMMERIVALRMARFEQLRDVLEEGERVAGDESTKTRLCEFGGVCDHLLRTMQHALDRWRKGNDLHER